MLSDESLCLIKLFYLFHLFKNKVEEKLTKNTSAMIHTFCEWNFYEHQLNI